MNDLYLAEAEIKEQEKGNRKKKLQNDNRNRNLTDSKFHAVKVKPRSKDILETDEGSFDLRRIKSYGDLHKLSE